MRFHVFFNYKTTGSVSHIPNSQQKGVFTYLETLIYSGVETHLSDKNEHLLFSKTPSFNMWHLKLFE